MSSIGRDRNHYSRIQKLSKRVDLVARDSTDVELMEQFGNQILRISKSEFETFEDTVLLSVFCDLLQLDCAALERLGSSLASRQLNSETSELLDGISIALHSEMASTLARLGSGR